MSLNDLSDPVKHHSSHPHILRLKPQGNSNCQGHAWLLFDAPGIQICTNDLTLWSHATYTRYSARGRFLSRRCTTQKFAKICLLSKTQCHWWRFSGLWGTGHWSNARSISTMHSHSLLLGRPRLASSRPTCPRVCSPGLPIRAECPSWRASSPCLKLSPTHCTNCCTCAKSLQSIYIRKNESTLDRETRHLLFQKSRLHASHSHFCAFIWFFSYLDGTSNRHTKMSI